MLGIVSPGTKQPFDNFILCERLYVTLGMSVKGKFYGAYCTPLRKDKVDLAGEKQNPGPAASLLELAQILGFRKTRVAQCILEAQL